MNVPFRDFRVLSGGLSDLHGRAEMWTGPLFLRDFVVRLRGFEPPRAKRLTRPSTLRVYQFRHSR